MPTKPIDYRHSSDTDGSNWSNTSRGVIGWRSDANALCKQVVAKVLSGHASGMAIEADELLSHLPSKRGRGRGVKLEREFAICASRTGSKRFYARGTLEVVSLVWCGVRRGLGGEPVFIDVWVDPGQFNFPCSF